MPHSSRARLHARMTPVGEPRCLHSRMAETLTTADGLALTLHARLPPRRAATSSSSTASASTSAAMRSGAAPERLGLERRRLTTSAATARAPARAAGSGERLRCSPTWHTSIDAARPMRRAAGAARPQPRRPRGRALRRRSPRRPRRARGRAGRCARALVAGARHRHARRPEGAARGAGAARARPRRQQRPRSPSGSRATPRSWRRIAPTRSSTTASRRGWCASSSMAARR